MRYKGIACRPKSSYLGNPQRKVNYYSKVFTTDAVSVEKHVDDIEGVILKYNKKPNLNIMNTNNLDPTKKIKIGIKLED